MALVPRERDRPKSRPSAQSGHEMDRQVQKSITEALNAKLGGIQQKESSISTIKLHGTQDYTIRVAEKRIDPLDPPHFRNRKAIALQQDDPAPILTAPSEKLSTEEQSYWHVPTCVSNWKNPEGYVIPMDKRVAADARRFEQPELSDRFAVMAKALDEASNSIKESLARKHQIERQLALRQQAEEEARIREEARRLNSEKKSLNRLKNRDERMLDRVLSDNRHERERIKRKNRERDTTAQVALGIPITAENADDEFDAQLFNRSGGLDAGYGTEDTHNVYDKPLFAPERDYVPFSESDLAGYAAPQSAPRGRMTISFKEGEQQRPDVRSGVFYPE